MILPARKGYCALNERSSVHNYAVTHNTELGAEFFE